MLQCISTYIHTKRWKEMLKKRKKMATFRLPEWVLVRLRSLDNGKSQAKNIEDALVATHEWERPRDNEDAN